jgi:predicted acylesterase/phospholipase RssA
MLSSTFSFFPLLVHSITDPPSHTQVPSMADIATQIAFVSACRQIRRVKGIADLYILPPVDKYSVLDFHYVQEIRQIGLDYGREAIAKWLDSLPIDQRHRLSWLPQTTTSQPKKIF